MEDEDLQGGNEAETGERAKMRLSHALLRPSIPDRKPSLITTRARLHRLAYVVPISAGTTGPGGRSYRTSPRAAAIRSAGTNSVNRAASLPSLSKRSTTGSPSVARYFVRTRMISGSSSLVAST